RRDFLVRAVRTPILGIAGLASRAGVEGVGAQTDAVADGVLDMRRVDGAVAWRRAAEQRALAGAGVGEESRCQTLHRERTRTAADLDLDARQLPSLLGVVRRFAEDLVHPRDVLRDRVGVELDARDDFRRGAGGGEGV